MRLGILRVGPPEAEVLGLAEIRTALFTRLVVGVGEGEAAVELVVHLVPGVDIHAIGTQGEIAAGQGEVEIVAQDEVHTGVLDEESAGDLLAEGRHQQTRGPGGLGRDETEGESDGDRDIGDHRISRSEDRLLGGLRHDLRHGQFHVIVRVLQVADRVHAFLHVHRLVRHHLDLLALQEAF